MASFEKNGILYTIKRNDGESDALYYSRCWYITNLNPQTDNEFIKYTKLSNIWCNIKYLNCKYSDEVVSTASLGESTLYSGF